MDTDVASSKPVVRRRPAPSIGRRLAGGAQSQVVLAVVSFAVLGGIWELLSAIDPPFWPQIILSRPTVIIPALWEALTTPFVWRNFWVTFQETLIGFTIAAVSAFFLGLLISASTLFRKAAYPAIILFQSTPRIALGPVFIAWFGFGMTSKVALSVTIAFFPVLVNTITGLSLVDENSLLLMRSLRASRFQTFMRLRLPSAMPTIFAGLKTSLTFALIGAIVGELLATNEGAGHLIEAASFQLRMEDVFAYLAMLGLFGLGLFQLMNTLERRLIFWHDESAS